MLHVSAMVLLSAGIIGGLLAYIVINGVNYLLDKLAECMHWSISGTDTQPLGGSGSTSSSFIGRMQSNTGGAAQVLVLCVLNPVPVPSLEWICNR